MSETRRAGAGHWRSLLCSETDGGGEPFLLPVVAIVIAIIAVVVVVAFGQGRAGGSCGEAGTMLSGWSARAGRYVFGVKQAFETVLLDSRII